MLQKRWSLRKRNGWQEWFVLEMTWKHTRHFPMKIEEEYRRMLKLLKATGKTWERQCNGKSKGKKKTTLKGFQKSSIEENELVIFTLKYFQKNDLMDNCSLLPLKNHSFCQPFKWFLNISKSWAYRIILYLSFFKIHVNTFFKLLYFGHNICLYFLHNGARYIIL